MGRQIGWGSERSPVMVERYRSTGARTERGLPDSVHEGCKPDWVPSGLIPAHHSARLALAPHSSPSSPILDLHQSSAALTLHSDSHPSSPYPPTSPA